MNGDLRFSEDVGQIAADAVELAPALCGSCRNFHTLWPYHRLAQAAGGDVAAPLVSSTLERLLAPGGRRILIGGSADSGLLAVVARASGLGADITVLDRCETPLELCRRYARRWQLPINVIHLDLTELTAALRYDVVFVHMLLQYVSSDRHLEILSRIRESLRSSGRLVLAFRTSPRISEDLAAEYRSGYPLQLIEQLEARGIALPTTRDAFRRQLEIYFEERRAREGTHIRPEQVERVTIDAGFEIEELTPIAASMSSPFVRFHDRLRLQRFLMVAAPKSQT